MAKHKIMIVDDEKISLRMSEHILSSEYDTVCASDGKTAIELYKTELPDLILSDLRMPEIDGFTMLRMIRTNGNLNHIPVILLTSKNDIGNRLEGLKHGADAYLTKPFSIDELHATIDNLIKSRQMLHGKYSGKQTSNEQINDIEVKGNDEQLMERVVDNINKHISDSDFTIETLCSEVGISRANLHRKMKSIAGITANDLMRNIRMEQAERLLVENKVNITQIAYSVGYASQTYFSTAFKKYYGISPTEFIEKHNVEIAQQENES